MLSMNPMLTCVLMVLMELRDFLVTVGLQKFPLDLWQRVGGLWDCNQVFDRGDCGLSKLLCTTEARIASCAGHQFVVLGGGWLCTTGTDSFFCAGNLYWLIRSQMSLMYNETVLVMVSRGLVMFYSGHWAVCFLFSSYQSLVVYFFFVSRQVRLELGSDDVIDEIAKKLMSGSRSDSVKTVNELGKGEGSSGCEECYNNARQVEVNEGKTSDLAAKLKSIDGTIVGRDGRVLKPVRGVRFADQVDDQPMDQSVVNSKGNVEASGNVTSTMNKPSLVSSDARQDNVNVQVESSIQEPNVTHVSSAYQQANANGPKQTSQAAYGSVNKDSNGWNWTSNGSVCRNASRIILGWNVDLVDLNVVAMTDQVVHTFIRFKADKKELFCSFVYAHNRYTHRRPLWDNLGLHNQLVRTRPWCVLGDFNSALNLEDKIEATNRFISRITKLQQKRKIPVQPKSSRSKPINIAEIPLLYQ
ncbi:RNA-directed DNA polymerase, eukaryota, Reverse transcriptase zinc-binding domain protein [Artemisia annua]|uniref:RNA-directed DNA polymerase, eukaryota, Reverse transcriptase zinc-binding domain protein n=1 Tax=Artemisia annua TaxID=35608 RepID=A0A2U1N546_ARTAN|nr:RNA-directed DNA polymerase, eukaryota, Reverse transcriptase zinc-binding domain protein [Artemisia annua]